MAIPVLSGLTDALNLYQRSVVDPIAGTALGLGNKVKMGLGMGDAGSQILDDYFKGGMGPGADADPTGALNFGTQGPAGAWGRFGLTAVTDPLNLVGMGIPGMLGKSVASGALHGLAAVPGLAKGLDMASMVDKLPGKLTSQGMDIAGHGLGAALAPPLNALAPHVEAFGLAHPDLASNWQQANLIWKSLNHINPGYNIANVADDASRVGAYGNWGALGDAASRGGNRGSTLFDELGKTSDTAGLEAANVPTQSPFTPASQLAPGVTPMPFQNWIERQQGNPIIRPVMSGLQKLTQSSMNVEGAIEKQMRGAVWGSDNSMDEIGKLSGLNPSGMTSAARNSPELAKFADDLESGGMTKTAQLLRDNGNLVGLSDLRNSMTSEGAGAAQASSLVDTYGTHPGSTLPGPASGSYSDILGIPRQNAAGKQLPPQSGTPWAQADDLTNKQMFNYASPDYHGQQWLMDHGNDPVRAEAAASADRVIRGLARNSFGGYKFATSNVPSMMRLAGAHPAIINVPQDYYRNSDQYNLMQGLGEGYHGQMPMGEIAGKQLMMNPFSLSSMGEMVGEMGKPDNPNDGATALGKIANTAGDIGYGLNPIIRAGLIATGQEGSKQLPDIFRALSPVSGVAGAVAGRPIDLEAPIKGAGSLLEQGLTHRITSFDTPTSSPLTNSFQDYLTRKRNVELAGGDPMAASGPNAAASQDVANQQAVESLVTALTGFRGMKQLAPEEQAIAGAQRQGDISQRFSGSDLASMTNPTRGANDIVDPLMDKIYHLSSLPYIEQKHLMEDPVVMQLITANRSDLLHSGPGGYTLR